MFLVILRKLLVLIKYTYYLKTFSWWLWQVHRNKNSRCFRNNLDPLRQRSAQRKITEIGRSSSLFFCEFYVHFWSDYLSLSLPLFFFKILQFFFLTLSAPLISATTMWHDRNTYRVAFEVVLIFEFKNYFLSFQSFTLRISRENVICTLWTRGPSMMSIKGQTNLILATLWLPKIRILLLILEIFRSLW